MVEPKIPKKSDDDRLVAGYYRVSQTESLLNGNSIPGQENGVFRYVLLSFGIEAKDVLSFEEPEAVGGDKPFSERIAGRLLIAAICSGKIKAIVVRQIDRLARSPEVWAEIQSVCIEHGVQIHTLSGQVQFMDPNGRFATGVQVLAAQLEREQTGARIVRAKHQIALQGRHTGGPPPYGYTTQAKYSRELLAKGNGESDARRMAEEKYPRRGHLYIDVKESIVVKLMFSLYINERIGTRSIAQELNGRGYRRTSGLLWNSQKVLKRINDPTLTGHIPYDLDRFERGGRGGTTPKHEQHLFEGQHDAIISLETWEQAQRIKEAATSKSTGRGDATAANRKNPLSGVLDCPCGRKMKATSQWKSKSKDYGYYTCYQRRDHGTDVKSGGCSFPTMRISKADEAFWSAIEELLSSPGLVDKVYREALKLRELRESQNHEGPTLQERLKKVVSSLDFYHQKDSEATEDFEREAIFERLKRLSKEKKELKTAIENEQAKPVATDLYVNREDIEKYFSEFAVAVTKSKDRGCGLVRVLQEHQGLKVKLVDADTLSVSLNLSPPGGTKEECVSAVVLVETIAKLPKDFMEQWVDKHQGKVKCKICKEDVKILNRHHSMGLPEYHHKCWASQLTKRRANPDPSKYYNGRQVGNLFGVGDSTVGRWRAKGKLPKPEKLAGVNLFNKQLIDEVKAKFDAAGGEFDESVLAVVESAKK